MPTRFCVKKRGQPSSINIPIDTIKKIGESNRKINKARSLLSILKQFKTIKIGEEFQSKVAFALEGS